MMDVNDIRVKILSAKEETYLAKCQAIMRHSLPLVSLALNVPGWPKTNKLLRKFFFDSVSEFRSFALAHRLIIVLQSEKILENYNGLTYFSSFEFPKSVVKAKEIAELFENDHPLGRFIDVDIVDSNSQIISSGKDKPCFICNSKSAIDCMRNETHSIKELTQFQIKSIENYFINKDKKKQYQTLSEILLNALLGEISLHPKPGLVTPLDQGSHSDMDFNSFLQSTSAISNTFTELFHDVLIENKQFSFEELRLIGIEAENKMKYATSNLNTHKGAIFLLLIISYSIARLLNIGEDLSNENIKREIRKFNSAIISDPLNVAAETHGNKVRNKTQNENIGIKAEILNGLPSIFEAGIPQLCIHQFSLQKSTKDKQKILVFSLLSIMGVLDDSNIVYRSHEKALQILKDKSHYALKTLQTDNWQPYINLCNWAKKENLSPGGAADILISSIFIYLCQINPNLKTYEF
jgi:holo-ACP synthase/triphosphoribosyl-dephospho-CoA synthase